jgi:hypothetical protein
MDFVDEFPLFCTIRTSLSTSQVDANWIHNILLLILGTHLKYTNLDQARELLSRMEARGFCLVTIADTPQSDIISGKEDDNDRWLYRDKRLVRCVPFVMPDPLGKTELIRFCFFFR